MSAKHKFIANEGLESGSFVEKKYPDPEQYIVYHAAALRGCSNSLAIIDMEYKFVFCSAEAPPSG